MTRRRLTQHRQASAAPALPTEAGGHPASYPDPDENAYMNGDPSSWAEDPTSGPYPNGEAPALPTEAGGHPASKSASREVRAAMEQKAARCIRIAQSMLGRKASVESIEDQALELMSLPDRQIAATLSRIADERSASSLREADDLIADDLLVDEEDVASASSRSAKKADEDELEEVEVEEEKDAAKKAAHYARLAAHYGSIASKSASKKSEDEEEEDLLAEMEEEEAKKSAAKKSEDDEDTEALLAEMLEEEEKKKSASKKSEDETDEDEAKKEAAKKSEDEAEDEEAKKEAAKKSEDEGQDEAADADDDVEASKKACGEEDGLMAEFGDDLDPMASMDDVPGMGDDEMEMLYGSHFASKKSEDEGDEGDEPKEEEEGVKKAAAVRPQPRRASTGVRTLGAVSKTASAASGGTEISELSKLWESAPDVSKIFG